MAHAGQSGVGAAGSARHGSWVRASAVRNMGAPVPSFVLCSFFSLSWPATATNSAPPVIFTTSARSCDYRCSLAGQGRSPQPHFPPTRFPMADAASFPRRAQQSQRVVAPRDAAQPPSQTMRTRCLPSQAAASSAPAFAPTPPASPLVAPRAGTPERCDEGGAGAARATVQPLAAPSVQATREYRHRDHATFCSKSKRYNATERKPTGRNCWCWTMTKVTNLPWVGQGPQPSWWAGRTVHNTSAKFVNNWWIKDG